MSLVKRYNKSIVSNLEIFKENRLDPHSAHRYFPGSRVEMPGTLELLEPQKDFEFYQSLNGIWKVHVSRNEECIPEGFYEADYDRNEEEKLFSDIRVPAHIQTEGFDHNAYVNYQYPWDGVEDIKPGQIPKDYNPVACYVNYFDINNYTENQPYRIVFEGVESNIALFINGQYVGYAEDSFTQSEFDITEYVKASDNRLACIVYKWCSSCFVDDQDFFRFSGIFRNVSIRTYKRAHIEDISVHTDLDDSYTDAVIRMDIKLALDAADCNLVRYALCRDGANVHFDLNAFGEKADHNIAGNSGMFVSVDMEDGIVASGESTFSSQNGNVVSLRSDIIAPTL